MQNRIDINSAYQKHWDDPASIRLFYGGAAAGRSYFCTQEMLYHIFSQKNENYLIIRKNDKNHKYSTYPLTKNIIESLGLWEYTSIKKSNLEIRIPSGNTIFFKGMDVLNRTGGINRFLRLCRSRGNPITKILIEEASELENVDFYDIYQSRIEDIQITLNFNPISKKLWIYKDFFENPKFENVSILQTTYKDNNFIDKEYTKVLEDMKDQDYDLYSVYCLGEWPELKNKEADKISLKKDKSPND